MNFGINGWWWSYPFCREEKFEPPISKARALGFDGIEVPMEDPKKLDIGRLKEALDSYGLPCSSVLPVFDKDRDLISADASIRENCHNNVKDNLKIASELDADVVLIIPSAVGKLHTILNREEEWRLAVEGLGEIGRFAADYDVYLVIEPLNRFETYFINLLRDAVELAIDVDHPNVRVMIDTFHFFS